MEATTPLISKNNFSPSPTRKIYIFGGLLLMGSGLGGFLTQIPLNQDFSNCNPLKYSTIAVSSLSLIGTLFYGIYFFYPSYKIYREISNETENKSLLKKNALSAGICTVGSLIFSIYAFAVGIGVNCSELK